MIIELVIVFCLAYSVALFAIYKIRINAFKVDRDLAIVRTRVQAEEIVKRTNELNILSARLNRAVKEVIEAKMFNDQIVVELEEKNRIVNEIHKDNLLIFANNKELLKENKMEVFNIRQASMFAYDHYKSMSDLLRNLLVFDDGEAPVFGHIRSGLDVVNASLKKVENYFKLYFRVGPAEYRTKKKTLAGKRPNGTDYVTDFSAS